ncbi:MAG: hypothetical protein QUS11_02720 [Candidatus Fermentibacter sp.]|nr:hypothetical protein [Candidatus Fermentibacter sp.]
MRNAVLTAFALGALTGTATSEDVFLSSPLYTITVTLDYTDPPDPYRSQGGIETYRSVSAFTRVSFGPSYMPDLPAMFSVEYGPAGSGEGIIPDMQITGTGVIETYDLQPAWGSDEPEEGIITSGPSRFEPTLTLVTQAEALVDEGTKTGEMPTAPLVSTVYMQFNENFSIVGPELEWVYPSVGGNYVTSSVVVFPVNLADLGQGTCFEITCPYESETATGTWTIRFTAD